MVGPGGHLYCGNTQKIHKNAKIHKYITIRKSRPSDIGCQYSRSIYTTRLIVWQPRRAADTSTNWRQSLFCCCTASMEQAADRAETAAIDGLVSSWFSIWFCLQAPGYGLTLWCGHLVGEQYLSYSYSYKNIRQTGTKSSCWWPWHE